MIATITAKTVNMKPVYQYVTQMYQLQQLTLRNPLSSETAFKRSSDEKLVDPKTTVFEFTISLKLPPLLHIDFQFNFVQNAVSPAFNNA
jgi:hypothetical protein